MSFIQVPIGKGITKFPNIRRSQPDKIKDSQKTTQTDLQFLHDIAEDIRFTVIHTPVTDEENLVQVQPPTGTTFYFIGAQVNNLDAAAQDFDIRTFESFVSSVNIEIKESIQVASLASFVFNIPVLKIVGNDNLRLTLRNITKNNATGSIWGYNENTERI